jgi:CRISPR-associated protein Cas2
LQVISIYSVTYDIIDDKKRTRYSKFLEKLGERVQHSVFSIRNRKSILAILLNEIQFRYEKQFDKCDSIYIFQICGSCKSNIIPKISTTSGGGLLTMHMRRNTLEGIQPESEQAIMASSFATNSVRGIRDILLDGPYYLRNASEYSFSPYLHRLTNSELGVPSSAFIHRVAEASSLYRLPLSPVGFFTTRTTGLRNASLLLTGSDFEFSERSKKGVAFDQLFFRRGPSYTTGLWITQSRAAAEQYQRDFMSTVTGDDKIHVIVQGRSVEPLTEDMLIAIQKRVEGESIDVPLSEDDYVIMMQNAIHESLHPLFNFMRRNNPLNSELAHGIIGEILAYREQIRTGQYSAEEVGTLLIKYYFSMYEEVPPGYVKAVVDAVNVASADFSPAYQGEISWRGLCTPDIWSFISPDELLSDKAKRLSSSAERISADYGESMVSVL